MSRFKRILVTGSGGFVGSRVVSALQGKFELITPAHSDMDITMAGNVESFIQDTRPDAILHLAAISNTGYCEEHPEESYLVNVTGVENLAEAAARHGSKLIFFSSDQIYNGNLESGLLTENMTVAPESHYGRHKLLAEERARVICPDCVALRATWMYDDLRPGMKTHNNFVLNFRNAMETGPPCIFQQGNSVESLGSTRSLRIFLTLSTSLEVYIISELRTTRTHTKQRVNTPECSDGMPTT